MSPPDPTKGLIEYLKSVTAVNDLISGRAFGDEVPKSETGSMPRKCIVVEPSGPGFLGTGYQDYGDGRFDVRSYGETPYEAARVQLAVYGAMKELRRARAATVLLHWAKRVGGPMPLRDPDTKWPYRFESYQVLVAEIPA